MGAELIESDRRYLAMGAATTPLAGAELAVLEGFEDLAAGCVVVRVPDLLPDAPDTWLDEVEAAIAARGAAWSRIYLTGSDGALPGALADRGYERTVEVGYLRVEPLTAASGYTARPVRDEADWTARTAVHASLGEGLDGHPVDPERFTAMERARCATGAMEPFVIESGGAVVGTVAAIPGARVLRMKNLAVRSGCRRRGAATAAVAHLLGVAHARGLLGVSAFALEGHEGTPLYAALAFEAVTRQFEWTRRR